MVEKFDDDLMKLFEGIEGVDGIGVAGEKVYFYVGSEFVSFVIGDDDLLLDGSFRIDDLRKIIEVYERFNKG